MKTISPAGEITRVVNKHLGDRGLPELSTEQAEVLATVVGRWYGTPIGTVDQEEMERARRGML
jgi:hypothetical protein